MHRRLSLAIAGHDFAIGRQLVQQLRDRGETLGEVVPIAAVDYDARAHLVGLHAVAIEFHLVQPAGTALAGTGLQGGMKRNSDTASGCSGINLARQLGLVAFRAVRIGPSLGHGLERAETHSRHSR